MIQPPRRNLPPDAEPWGRWVEGLLLAQNQAGEANGQSINNTLRGVNASLQQLGNQIQTLSAQQATLSAQQADITSLLSDQVKFGRAGGYVSNYSFGTDDTVLLSLTIPVPAGYSKAIVFAICNASIVSDGTGNYYYIKASVNSVTTAQATRNFQDTSGLTVTGSASTAQLSGLSGGSIPIYAIGRAATGSVAASASNTVTLDGFAIFTK